MDHLTNGRTDAQLLDYLAAHTATNRILFKPEEIERLLFLAGSKLSVMGWKTVHQGETQDFVAVARLRMQGAGQPDPTLRDYPIYPSSGAAAETPDDLLAVLKQLAGMLNKEHPRAHQLLGRVWRVNSPILRRIDQELRPKTACTHILGRAWLLNPEEGHAFIVRFVPAGAEPPDEDWIERFAFCPCCGARNPGEPAHRTVKAEDATWS